MKKLLSGLIALSLAATLFAGCAPNLYSDGNTLGGTTSSGGDTSGDTTKVALKVWGTQDDQSLLKTMGDTFNSLYTVSPSTMGPTDAKAELLKNPAGSADVVLFSSDQLAELVAANALLPVSNGDAVKAANTDASIAAASVGDTLYAYPSSAETYFLYYDKSKLSEEDIQSVESILSKSINGVSTNFAMNFTDGYYTASFFFANGCTLFGANGQDATSCDFNSEAGAEAAKALIQVAADPKAGNFKDEQIIAGFQNGTLAAAVSGSWNADSIVKSLGENFGCAKLPTVRIGGEDKQLVSFGNFMLYGVNASSKTPDAAQELADYLTNQANQRMRLEQKSLAPTNKALILDEELMNPQKPGGDEKEDSKAAAARYARYMQAAIAEQGAFQVTQSSIPQMDRIWAPFTEFGQGILEKSISEDNIQESLDKLVSGILFSSDSAE